MNTKTSKSAPKQSAVKVKDLPAKKEVKGGFRVPPTSFR